MGLTALKESRSRSHPKPYERMGSREVGQAVAFACIVGSTGGVGGAGRVRLCRRVSQGVKAETLLVQRGVGSQMSF